MFCYLTMITDAYSHEIIGWAVGDSLETRHSVEALMMALQRLEGAGAETAGRLIHHSDRGVQYAAREYTDILKGSGILISMTENGGPKENALAEKINSTVKNELLKGLRFTCMKEACDALAVAIGFYNTRRPHISVDMMPPEQAAGCNGEIRK